MLFYLCSLRNLELENVFEKLLPGPGYEINRLGSRRPSNPLKLITLSVPFSTYASEMSTLMIGFCTGVALIDVVTAGK
jgi:hypothetical protein